MARRPTWQWASGLGLCAILTGCEVGYGLSRTAPLDALPDLDCVAHVLAATPGITHVDTTIERSAAPLYPRAPHGHTSYNFVYHGDAASRVWAALQIRVDVRDRITFEQSLHQLNRAVPQADVDATRPVMALVERRLQAQCRIPGLVRRIVERCEGVRCEPLAAAR
jgi:hypothetical protein